MNLVLQHSPIIKSCFVLFCFFMSSLAHHYIFLVVFSPMQLFSLVAQIAPFAPFLCPKYAPFYGSCVFLTWLHHRCCTAVLLSVITSFLGLILYIFCQSRKLPFSPRALFSFSGKWYLGTRSGYKQDSLLLGRVAFSLFSQTEIQCTLEGKSWTLRKF